MDEVSQLTEFGKVFIYMIIGIILVFATFFASSLIALRKPNQIKLSSYECGEEPTGTSWIQFDSRFYVLALVFLLFDVEMAFIFPWTTVFGQQTLINADARWGWLSLSEMFIFVGILILGLVYVWKKGDLEWIRPVQDKPKIDTAMPLSVYDKINHEKYTVKKFSLEPAVKAEAATSQPANVTAKPAFKPAFRKPAAQ